ncbi:MAG: flagellar export protein FliJ [Acetivibrionales bacterium]|jgi:flagellar FliJ protein|nr:flagellar export protein FliJ [Clostridiaceae bacterium]
MAGFKFRLQTFLKLKEQLEKNAKNELGIAIIKLEEEKSKLKVIEDNIDNTTNDFKNACSGVINPERIKELKTYLEHLQHAREKQKENVKREQKNVDIIRERLVEIMKERKVLENLKEKEFQEYLKDEQKKEQQQVDELVSYNESKDVPHLLDGG